MQSQLASFRSLLFIPANVQKYIDKAHTRGADAIILDLEDSVPESGKSQARESVSRNAALLKQHGLPVLVRVNNCAEHLSRDLSAVMGENITAIVVPKVETAAEINRIAHVIDCIEAAQDIGRGLNNVLVQIESVEALPNLDSIASARRVAGMVLGSEDFCESVGANPTAETLYQPNQMIVFACRRAGIVPLGFPGSIAEFEDLTTFQQTVRRGREMGFRGAFCIHPDQAKILNEVFSPSEEELSDARGVIAAYSEALSDGRAAAKFNRHMIDAAVVARAQATLKQAR
jgi:citrate lyase subunit beta/citryl-CoA lyase